jgi:hypothetical protein
MISTSDGGAIAGAVGRTSKGRNLLIQNSRRSSGALDFKLKI